MDIFCSRCERTMAEKNFYKSNNTEKYPTGFFNICKKCATAHLDIMDADTYLWLLQELDVPYVPEAMNKLLLTYSKEPGKTTGAAIFGRYMSKMRLKEFKEYRWKDTEKLQEMADLRKVQAMKRQGFNQAQIDEFLLRGAVTIPDQPLEIPDYPPPADIDNNVVIDQQAFLDSVASAFRQSSSPGAAPQDDYFAEQAGFTDEELGLSLTDEDKKMLYLKWGKTYKPAEWIQLEKFYNEMMQSYDIQTAAHVDTLKLICKTSLKAHQLIDLGDIEGYQKASRVYDLLMKSGKFNLDYEKLFSVIAEGFLMIH